MKKNLEARLTNLHAILDKPLNEFQLTKDASGRAPWEAHQDDKRKKKLIIGGATAAAAAGAGVAGRKVYQAYGGADGAPIKEVARNVGRDVARTAQETAGAATAKGKEMAGAAVAKGREAMERTGKYARRAGSAGMNRAKSSLRATGEMKYPLLKRGLKAGAAAIRGIKGVRFERIQRLVNLEAKMDESLTAFDAR